MVYETNVFGPIRVSTAFVPLLKRSDNPIILNVTSALGSVTEMADPNCPWNQFKFVSYNTSKSALNSYTVVLAYHFKEAKVNCINPGYVATNLNNYSGLLTPQESAAGVIKVGILLGKDGPTGKYLDHTGKFEHPW